MDIRELNFAGEQLCPEYGNTAEKGAFLFGFTSGAMWFEEKNGWNDVFKKQPVTGTKVLVATEFEAFKSAIYNDDRRFYDVIGGLEITGVSHWLPLPSLPKSK